MKILIFGASGRTGKELVNQSLGREHEVTAFVRDSNSLESKRNLTILTGDVMKPDSVQKAFGSYDVVFSVLGSKKSKGDKVRSQGTLNILKAMIAANNKRFICISSLIIAEEFTGFITKKIIIPLFHKEVHEEYKIMENYVLQSNLQWTIVRPPRLTNTRRTGQYRILLKPSNYSVKKISRADVADFMLKEAGHSLYLKQKPVIGY